MSIKENIGIIKGRIDDACIKARRDIRDITLVAVTKTVDAERIMEAVGCGLNVLGENKVQEILEKYDHIKGDVAWHMIGHLQTNKVKYIADKVSMIHSVDSIKLAEEINKRFKNCGRIIDILVEINIGGEDNKHGIKPEETVEFIKCISEYSSIKVMGLMTVAPAFEDAEKSRPYFKEMKNIFDEVGRTNIQNINMKYLSMGMTNDFDIALEEGSNIIRIGTGIFGARNYKY